jgi:hypothetical protein
VFGAYIVLQLNQFKDWSTLLTRKYIHVYPEILEPGSPKSELWHFDKWSKEMDLDVLSPMFDKGGIHYYVNELSRLANGDLVVPFRWVIFRGEVCAESFNVVFDDMVNRL